MMCCTPNFVKLVVCNHAEIIANRITTVCGLDIIKDYPDLMKEMQLADWMQQLRYVEELKEVVIKGDESIGCIEETLIGTIETHKKTYDIRNHATKGVYVC